MSYDVAGLGLSGGKKSSKRKYMYAGIGAVVVVVVLVLAAWYLQLIRF